MSTQCKYLDLDGCQSLVSKIQDHLSRGYVMKLYEPIDISNSSTYTINVIAGKNYKLKNAVSQLSIVYNDGVNALPIMQGTTYIQFRTSKQFQGINLPFTLWDPNYTQFESDTVYTLKISNNILEVLSSKNYEGSYYPPLTYSNFTYDENKYYVNCCTWNIKTSAGTGYLGWANRYNALKSDNFLIHPYCVSYTNNAWVKHNIYTDLDVIALQECNDSPGSMYEEDGLSLTGQMNDMYEYLHQYGYECYAPFRGTVASLLNPMANEALPIFWKSSKFRCLDKGKFWLRTKTNNGYLTEGTNWGGEKRICSWVKLEDKRTKCRLLIMNLHLTPWSKTGYGITWDGTIRKVYEGEVQRWSINVLRYYLGGKNDLNNSNSSTIIGKPIPGESTAKPMPIIIMGDFNCNYTTKTNNGDYIIEALTGTVRSSDSGVDITDLGTDFVFYNTTSYGQKSRATSKYGKTVYAGNTHTGASVNSTWDIKSAYVVPGANPSYTNFDYIFVSRWPRGYNGSNSTSSDLYVSTSQDSSRSFIGMPGGIDCDQISDHCPIVSQIVVENYKNYYGV